MFILTFVMDDLSLLELVFPVQTIMEFLGAGDSIDEVLEAYPSLEREDVYACIRFAAKLMANHYQIQKIA